MDDKDNDSWQPSDKQTRRWERFLNGVFRYFVGATVYAACGVAGLLLLTGGKISGLRGLFYAGVVFVFPLVLFAAFYIVWMLFSILLAEITALSGTRSEMRPMNKDEKSPFSVE